MIVAFDTSCYTTSVSIMEEDRRLLKDERRLLTVKLGERGLRQSDALFAHIKNLPDLIEEACEGIDRSRIKAIAASVRPRPVEGSYMPVFRAGELAARTMAASLGKPFFAVSHQEGHIAAALWSLKMPFPDKPFIAVHISGGTGEILHVTPREAGFDVEVCGTTDLAPGQFVDRVGVSLGLNFPAGPCLEELALVCPKTDLSLKVAVHGCDISFSGPETAAQRAIIAGRDRSEIARAVFNNIGKSLRQAVATAMENYGCSCAVIAGGVAANGLIREFFVDSSNVFFAQPHYASDNAVGIAELGLRRQDSGQSNY